MPLRAATTARHHISPTVRPATLDLLIGPASTIPKETSKKSGSTTMLSSTMLPPFSKRWPLIPPLPKMTARLVTTQLLTLPCAPPGWVTRDSTRASFTLGARPRPGAVSKNRRPSCHGTLLPTMPPPCLTYLMASTSSRCLGRRRTTHLPSSTARRTGSSR